MKKKLIATMILGVLMMTAGCTAKEITPEINPKNDPVEIRFIEDLAGIEPGGVYNLARNLDFENEAHYKFKFNKERFTTKEGWKPVYLGNGVINGQGYYISNLYINRPAEESVGLFSSTDRGSEINSLGLINAEVTGGFMVGALVGTSQGVIAGGFVEGEVTGNRTVGGVAGSQSHSDINTVNANVDVTGGVFVGGLVGYLGNKAGLYYAYVDGTVVGDTSVGGAVGNYGDAYIANGYSKVDVWGREKAGTVYGDFYTDILNEPGDFKDLGTLNMTEFEFENEEIVGGIVGKTAVIPNAINGIPVRKIAPNAFNERGLTKVIFSTPREMDFDSDLYLTEIGAGAFAQNELVNLVIPETVHTIGYSAFENNKIESLMLPEEMDHIGDSAFMNNRIESLKIPKGVKTIEAYAFSQNQLNHLTLPEGLETIGFWAFEKNNIPSISLPLTLEWIMEGAFADNYIHSITFPANVTWVGEFAFTDNPVRTYDSLNPEMQIGITAFDEMQ